MNATPRCGQLPALDLRSLVSLLRPLLSGLLVALLGWGAVFPAAAWARQSTAEPAVPVQVAPGASIQPYLDRVAEQISEFTLDNGMRFIVLQRPKAPVVSFMIYADAGSVNEVDGKTGIAHYLEHLAFKGTTRIGTRDYRAEKVLLEKLDQTFGRILAAEDAGDVAQAAQLKAELETLQQQAASYVEQNKYGQIVEQAGGVGLNATTATDATRYFYSLPANKLELWMSLESERFLDPVFREFYEEKNVILEERRMRVDNSPIGKMIEEFQGRAFENHPYRRPVIGYEADLYRATRQDIQDFYDTYYGPGNLIAVVVGDVDAAKVEDLAKTYFGRYQAKTNPPQIVIDEPPQTAPREFTLELPSEPWYLEGYHRPSLADPDHVVYGIIDSLLVGGRTSRIYKKLVVDEQIALDVGSLNGFPGDKYANLFVLYALTAPGRSVEDVAAAFEQELTQLKQTPVSPEELDRVKTQARAGLLRTLSSNSGMASLLAEYEAKTGSWRTVFAELDDIDAVTAADVQRVANTTFLPNNRIVGKLLSSQASPAEASPSGG